MTSGSQSWERVSSLLQRYRKIATGVLPAVLVAHVWLSRRPGVTAAGCAAGSALLLVGVGLRMWAAGHMGCKRDGLTVSGPYAHTRHPLYLGSLVAGLGLCAASGAWWSPLLIVVLFPLFYFPAIIREERALAKRHGDRYQEYRQRVPALWWRPTAFSEGGEFSFRQAMSHQEHHYAAQLVAIIALFWLRLLMVGP